MGIFLGQRHRQERESLGFVFAGKEPMICLTTGPWERMGPGGRGDPRLIWTAKSSLVDWTVASAGGLGAMER
jgi:hypothetical protein